MVGIVKHTSANSGSGSANFAFSSEFAYMLISSIVVSKARCRPFGCLTWIVFKNKNKTVEQSKANPCHKYSIEHEHFIIRRHEQQATHSPTLCYYSTRTAAETTRLLRGVRKLQLLQSGGDPSSQTGSYCEAISPSIRHRRQSSMQVSKNVNRNQVLLAHARDNCRTLNALPASDDSQILACTAQGACMYVAQPRQLEEASSTQHRLP